MGIKITIKLDSNKIRIYLESNELTIKEIESYLINSGYKNIDEYLKVEEKSQNQKVLTYAVAQYSLAYRLYGSENNKTLSMETWFNIKNHFSDETLSTAIEELVIPLLPPVNDELLPKPNMKVSGLKPRNYLTVFEQDENSLNDVLKLIYRFESMVLDVRKQAGLGADKIPSEVEALFKKIPPALHANGLKIFGLMPMPNSYNSASVGTVYSSYSNSSSGGKYS